MTSEVVPFGDSAWLIHTDHADRGAHRLADAIRRAGAGAGAAPATPAGRVEVLVGFGSVVIEVGDADTEPDPWETWLTAVVGRLGAAGPDTDRPGASAETGAGGRRVEIPVDFDGPDMEGVAAELGIGPSEVVDLLVGADLRVAFLGFSPGFPYLVGLPAELASIARHATPRTSVPTGSVAVAGGFAAIYPQPTPGGWRLLGRTDFPLFDPDTPPFALLRAGDRVRLRRQRGPIRAAVGDEDIGSPGHRKPVVVAGPRAVEVVEPGLFSLVQDGGRGSLGAIGVPRAGPADPMAMALANRLVGNDDGDAALELTARGPTLRFETDAHLAVVGAAADAASVAVDNRPVTDGTVVPVSAGQEVTIGTIGTGLRAYLAISGGIEIPVVAGSRSSDVLSGLGMGPLMIGDRLGLGAPGRPHGLLTHTGGRSAADREWTVRVVAGPHRFHPSSLEALVSSEWEVGGASNRIGLRLRSDSRVAAPSTGGIPSTGMVTGAIQVPPDGQPIILMPDHATVGGYPVIATVIAADRGHLGQVRPGDTVRLELVDMSEARRAQRDHRRQLARRVSGWFPTESGT